MYVIACIPAFNEGNKIKQVVKECMKYVDSVVVCDDHSADNTFDEAESAGAYVIKHEENKGKGAALKSLFRFARNSNADAIVTIDGDGQFLPNEIKHLLGPVEKENVDVVIGYRFDDKTEMPSYRKVGNKFLDTMTNLASDLPFRDTQSGFRAYSRKAYESISFQTDGFGADSEILVDASKKDLKISEQKVTVIYNTGSKTSTTNPVSQTSHVLGSIIESIAIRHPLKFLGIPGIILLFVGIFFSIITISVFNDVGYFSVPTTLVSIGTLVIGTMMLLICVLLYSISRIMMKK